MHGSETELANSCFWKRVLQERLRNEHLVCTSSPFRVTFYFFFNKIKITKIKNVPQAPKYVGHPEEVVWIALKMKLEIKCLDHSSASSARWPADLSGGSLPAQLQPWSPRELPRTRLRGTALLGEWQGCTAAVMFSNRSCSSSGSPHRAVACPSRWHTSST